MIRTGQHITFPTLAILLVIGLLASSPVFAQAKKKKKDDPFTARLEQIKAQLKEEEAMKKKAQKEALKEAKNDYDRLQNEGNQAVSNKFSQGSVEGAAKRANKQTVQKEAIYDVDSELSAKRDAAKQKESEENLRKRNERLESDPAFRDLMKLVANKKAQAIIDKEEQKRKAERQKKHAQEEAIARRKRAKARQERRELLLAQESAMRSYNRAQHLAEKKKKRDANLKRIRNLSSKYPQGITEEIITEVDREIVKRILVEGKVATEYLKITHSWGGVFYFRNGLDIPEGIWDSETNI